MPDSATNHRSTIAVTGAAILWAMVGMYALGAGPLALIGLLPVIALALRPRSVWAPVVSMAFSLAATLVGVAVFLGSTSGNRIELVGFVLIPIAATVFSAIGWASRDGSREAGSREDAPT